MSQKTRAVPSSMHIGATVLIFGAACTCLIWAHRGGALRAAVTCCLALGPALAVLFWARLRRAALPRGLLLGSGCAAGVIQTVAAGSRGIALPWLGVVVSGSLVVAADIARFEHANRRRALLHALVLGGAWLLLACAVGAFDLQEVGSRKAASGHVPGWLAVVAGGLVGVTLVAWGVGAEALYGSAQPRRLGFPPPVEPTLRSVVLRGLGAMGLTMLGSLGALLLTQRGWAVLFLSPAIVPALAVVVALPVSVVVLVARAVHRQEPRDPSPPALP